MAREPGQGGFLTAPRSGSSKGGCTDDPRHNCLSGERPKQTDSGRYNPCRSSGILLNGGVYANGIAWFVEPDADTAIAFVQDVSKVYKGSTKATKAYWGSTELDRIYKGSTRVF